MKTKRENVLRYLKANLLAGAVLLSMFAVGQTQNTQNKQKQTTKSGETQTSTSDQTQTQRNVQSQSTKATSFKDWDKNNDKKISKSEFNDRYSKDYARDWSSKNTGAMNQQMDKSHMDENKDVLKDDKNDKKYGDQVGTANTIDDEDFYRSSYSSWDLDKDEKLSQNEWKYGFDSSYGDYVSDDYKKVDTNGDGYVDYDEYHNSLGKTDYYSKYDSDNNKSLNDKELSDMVFGNWDFNKDNYIDENEFNKYQKNYIDFKKPQAYRQK